VGIGLPSTEQGIIRFEPAEIIVVGENTFTRTGTAAKKCSVTIIALQFQF